VTANNLADARWRTSTRSSGTGQCVEVANVDGGMAVRDSKDRSGPTLVFGAASWRNFLASVVAAESAR
jgi:Domain of unknown function (DUF397)